MAAVPRVTGSKLLIQIGNGGTPTETFAHDCLINTSRGIQFTSDTQDFVMPDCTNPDDPSWKEVTKDGLQATVTGEGMLYAASVQSWFNWWKGSATKNCRVMLNLTGANGGGYWSGAFHLTSFEIKGDGNKDTAVASVSLVSSGALTWTSNA